MAGDSRPKYGDRAILSANQDRFQRRPFAIALAKQIAALPADDSHVIGLLGSWGSGKTSIINMVTEAIEGTAIVPIHFNPWLFHGVEQLTLTFFEELAAQLTESDDKQVQQVGQSLRRFGSFMAPLLKGVPHAAWAAEGVQRLGDYINARGGGLAGSVYNQRKQISALLEKAGRRLLVVLDDLDRLRVDEIREVMRLIRLTADFPSVTYLLAFDRKRVARALAQEEEEGDAYLEKILQYAVDVPAIRPADLRLFFAQELELAIAGRHHWPLDSTHWANVFFEVVGPLLRTPRDARRIALAIPLALDVVGEEIALPDLIALETVRLVLPNVFSLLPQYAPLLTGEDKRKWNSHEETPLAELLKGQAGFEGVTRALCIRLFPMSRAYIDNHHYGDTSLAVWRKERRVAHPGVLRFYFEKSLPENALASKTVQDIYDALTQPAKLDSLLGSLSSERLENAFGRLEEYERDIPPSAAEMALPVMLKESLRLREGRLGTYDLGADLTLGRIMLRMLRRVADSERGAVVERVMAATASLSRRLDVVQIVGHEPGIGHKLLPQEQAERLAAQFETDCRNSSAAQLGTERNLYALVEWCFRRHDPPDEIVSWVGGRAAENRRVVLTLLTSSLTEHLRQSVEDLAPTRTDELPWDSIGMLVPSEVLAATLEADWPDTTPRQRLAIEVARKYVAGWRPPERPKVKESDAGERRVLTLLSSGIYQHREEAYGVVERALNDAALPLGLRGAVSQQVLERLKEVISKRTFKYPERARALRLLTRAGEGAKVRAALAEEWLNEPGVTSEFSALIASLFTDDPAAFDELLGVLQAVPMNEAQRRVSSQRVLDAISTVNTVIQSRAGSLSQEQAIRARRIVESFEGDERVAQLKSNLARLIEGEEAPR